MQGREVKPASVWQEFLIERPPPAVLTIKLVAYGFWRISGRDCEIYLQPRPVHCDRGNWVAHVEPRPGSGLARDMDAADNWPRYYFDLERAKLEVEAWLEKRKQKL